ncbi:MAG: hypothetical protein WDW36_004553 [Sanguina aurantia]
MSKRPDVGGAIGGRPAQRRRAGFVLPDGWLECPQFGAHSCFHPLRIVPVKVPLGHEYDSLVPPECRWGPLQAVETLLSTCNIHVGMIIDLTNSSRYYNLEYDMSREAINYYQLDHKKIPCRGRGQSPEPKSVNTAVWEIWKFMQDPNRQKHHIMIHCTHGFNRSGYVIACALLRLVDPSFGITNVPRALRRFAEARAPGIYKDEYINDLFKYHHERRDHHSTVTPPVPAWKGTDAEDAADEVNETGVVGHHDDVPRSTAPPGAPLSHDNVYEIGEAISEDETYFIQQQVYQIIHGHSPHPDPKGIRFPGSQPVSLDRGNLNRVADNRYMVSWKADGTRYMLWVDQRGVYVIDRSNRIARVQMRFPSAAFGAAAAAQARGVREPSTGKGHLLYIVGPQHTGTLLDGEMVVDHDPATGNQFRRFLAYDLVMFNTRNLVKEPWKVRWQMITDMAVRPRQSEKDYIAMAVPKEDGKAYTFEGRTYTAGPYYYDYDDEPFRVRRKEFFFLFDAPKVLKNMQASNIGHETDGLILQGYLDPYVAGTCRELLKWKFASMNSVDFILHTHTDRQGRLLPGGQLAHPHAHEGGTRGLGHRVLFGPHENPLMYQNKVIECALDPVDQKLWHFMRERKDKLTANAYHVYQSVVKSINDKIEAAEIIIILMDIFLRSPTYDPDRAKLPRAVLETLQRDLDARVLEASQAAQEPHQQHHLQDKEAPPPGGHVMQEAHHQQHQQQQQHHQQHQQQQQQHRQQPADNTHSADAGDMSPYRCNGDLPCSPEYVPGADNDYNPPPWSPFRCPGELPCSPEYLPGCSDHGPATAAQRGGGASHGQDPSQEGQGAEHRDGGTGQGGAEMHTGGPGRGAQGGGGGRPPPAGSLHVLQRSVQGGERNGPTADVQALEAAAGAPPGAGMHGHARAGEAQGKGRESSYTGSGWGLDVPMLL